MRLGRFLSLTGMEPEALLAGAETAADAGRRARSSDGRRIVAAGVLASKGGARGDGPWRGRCSGPDRAPGGRHYDEAKLRIGIDLGGHEDRGVAAGPARRGAAGLRVPLRRATMAPRIARARPTWSRRSKPHAGDRRPSGSGCPDRCRRRRGWCRTPIRPGSMDGGWRPIFGGSRAAGCALPTTPIVLRCRRRSTGPARATRPFSASFSARDAAAASSSSGGSWTGRAGSAASGGTIPCPGPTARRVAGTDVLVRTARVHGGLGVRAGTGRGSSRLTVARCFDGAEDRAAGGSGGCGGAGHARPSCGPRGARACAVVNMLDPDVIVIGGGLSHLDASLSRAAGPMAPHIFGDDRHVRVVPPRWGDPRRARCCVALGGAAVAPLDALVRASAAGHFLVEIASAP